MKRISESRTYCTDRDRQLEDAINARLAGRGRVALYTIKGEPERYGLCFSHGSKSHLIEHNAFDWDVDRIVTGLGSTAQQMENTKLPRGWVYSEDEAAQVEWGGDIHDA
jgi:hypothetical protein